MSIIRTTTRRRVLYEARELWRNGFVTYDSETTGPEWEDQIIQWAVCDQEGKTLGTGYVKPTVEISEEAFEKHGIRIEQLADAPTFADVWPEMRELLAGKTIVIYNANFDIGKIWSSARVYGIEIPFDDIINDVCAMHLFARFYGEVHEYYGTYIWQRLNEVAIPSLKINVPGQAHHAVHDAMATALIIKKLAELADQELPAGWHPPVNVPCMGCHQIMRECAEADEIWYCQRCGLEHGVFHRCPGCTHVVERSVTGFSYDDLCTYCQRTLHQEAMLLTGAWHYCPDSPHHIVQTPNLEEPCENCALQRKWKRQQEEAERARQERIERERKERRRASAKAYRQRQKENRHRAELGLPPLEIQKATPANEIIHHRGHQFRYQKDQYGRNEVCCLICEAIWSSPPRCYCAGTKTYRDWSAIPEHLKTRTQLLKLHLIPAPHQQAEAVMQGSFGDRYHLYNQTHCITPTPKPRAKRKTASSST